jgi:hypothetical protein
MPTRMKILRSAGIAVTLALVAITAGISIAKATGGSSSALPADDAALMSELDAQMDAMGADFIDETRASAPALRLDPADAEAWISAWEEMRQCAADHGYPGVPEAPATFGDGLTPPPVILVTDENSAALAACPFDTSGLNLEALREAARSTVVPSGPHSEVPFDLPPSDPSPELLVQMELFMKSNDPVLYDSFPDSASRQRYILEQFNGGQP